LLSIENRKVLDFKFSNPNHGASDLAEMAYLENYEFIEGGLEAYNETIMEETELIFRDLLVNKDDVEAVIQMHVEKINSNLDQANSFLANPTNSNYNTFITK
jgi:hypothetical protein